MSKVPSATKAVISVSVEVSETRVHGRLTVHLPVAKEEADKIVVWREDVVVVKAVGFLGRSGDVVRAFFQESRPSWSEGDEVGKGQSTLSEMTCPLPTTQERLEATHLVLHHVRP